MSRPQSTLPTSDPINPSLATFRGATSRLPIHPLENALLWAVGAHLVFLPWALGTMRLWAQLISLALAIVGFVVALWPRNYTPEHTGGPSFRLIPLPKLLKFPVFWLGLALLALVTVQALNPAWAYTADGKSWWMRRIDHITWLPAGVEAPLVQASGLPQGNPWRSLIVYSSALMTVCSIWIGFTRRRSLQKLFILIAVNGLALALFGLAQRILGADKIFWFVTSPNPAFFSSFIYKNHAGGYLLLPLAVASALGAWYFVRGVRRLEKSNPSGVFGFIATCIAVSILISYARGATLTMLIFLSIVVIGFLYHQWRLPSQLRSPLIALAMLAVFGFFLKTGLQALHSELAWDRLRQALSGQDLSVQARAAANEASLDMLRDTWVKGVGARGFQYVFPKYQQHHPEAWKPGGGGRAFWENAHNDILQFPIELGLAGMLLIAAAFVYWGFVVLRNYGWQNPLTVTVILGCGSLVGMAWGEFVFQCAAILITWCALWPAVARWTILEERRAQV